MGPPTIFAISKQPDSRPSQYWSDEVVAGSDAGDNRMRGERPTYGTWERGVR